MGLQIYDHISEVEETILKALVASPAFQDVDLGEILREREERSAMVHEALPQRKGNTESVASKPRLARNSRGLTSRRA